MSVFQVTRFVGTCQSSHRTQSLSHIALWVLTQPSFRQAFPLHPRPLPHGWCSVGTFGAFSPASPHPPPASALAAGSTAPGRLAAQGAVGGGGAASAGAQCSSSQTLKLQGSCLQILKILSLFLCFVREAQLDSGACSKSLQSRLTSCLLPASLGWSLATCSSSPWHSGHRPASPSYLHPSSCCAARAGAPARGSVNGTAHSVRSWAGAHCWSCLRCVCRVAEATVHPSQQVKPIAHS